MFVLTFYPRPLRGLFFRSFALMQKNQKIKEIRLAPPVFPAHAHILFQTRSYLKLTLELCISGRRTTTDPSLRQGFGWQVGHRTVF